jgi:hypothetical protein
LRSLRLCGLIPSQIICNPLNAIPDQCRVPVDQKSQLDLTQFEIGQDLRHVDWMDFFNAFVFNDDQILHQHIDPVPGINFLVIVVNGL